LHCSFALVQAQDWPGAADAVRREPHWWLHVPLCLRLAQSAFHQQRRSDALQAWFHLCWRAPDEAAAALNDRRQPDTGTSALWRRFVDSEEEPSAGLAPQAAASAPQAAASAPQTAASAPVLTAAEFPAWLLLHEPGLNRQLGIDLPTGDTAAEQAYRTVHRWIDARRSKCSADELTLRKTLQAQHLLLFQYLKRVV
jgi:hypothetical protein